MGHPKPESIISPIKGGSGSQSLSPPWARDQVRWLGRGYFVLRLATDETSRWLLGGGFRWSDVFPHERTFKRSAHDKCSLIGQLKMNPWPVHLAAPLSSVEWRDQLAMAVGESSFDGRNIKRRDDCVRVFDTGHVTLWRVAKLPRNLLSTHQFIVLDGHHSRRAQRNLGLKNLFGWLEPLAAPQLSVRSIDRGGWLAQWIDECIHRGDFIKDVSAPDLSTWSMENSLKFEVVQASKRFWCEIGNPQKNESAVDALTRLAKGRVFLKASSNFEEILSWLERLVIDTGLRLPPPSKEYVLARALKRSLFPQKATYFHPKVPFGILVEDLK